MACRLLRGKIDKKIWRCRVEIDRLLANARSKDYIRVEREGSNRRLVRRESANDANEKVAKANGQNR